MIHRNLPYRFLRGQPFNFWEDGMVALPDVGQISEVVSSCLLKSKFWNILASYFAYLSVK